jgi:hypothetical protein
MMGIAQREVGGGQLQFRGMISLEPSSAFNGREPDDLRYDIDLAALDSYSGRLWFLPSPQWALQVSAGHLTQAESRASGPRADVDRITASAGYHCLINDRVWATTIAWGRNREASRSTSAFVVETAADLSMNDTLFARGEMVGKTATEHFTGAEPLESSACSSRSGRSDSRRRRSFINSEGTTWQHFSKRA